MQPSFSGLFVICAYLLSTTLPVWVTNPNSVTLTSITVPLVNTPKLVYKELYGFLLTPTISKAKVVYNSGCVTFAFLNLKPVGLMNLSYLGGFLV